MQRVSPKMTRALDGSNMVAYEVLAFNLTSFLTTWIHRALGLN